MTSNNEHIKLTCKRVKFYSTQDKHAFFNALKEIEAVIDVKGKDDAIILTLDDKYIRDEDVAALTALFRRYFICLDQLEALGVDEDGFPRYQDFETAMSYCVYPPEEYINAAKNKSTKNDIPEGEVVLQCVGKFFDQEDEDAFFMWLNKIETISKITGSGTNLKLHVQRNKTGFDDLYPLLALFTRYNIPNTEQFQQFLNDENKEWFKNKDAFWYKDVFGKKLQKSS